MEHTTIKLGFSSFLVPEGTSDTASRNMPSISSFIKLTLKKNPEVEKAMLLKDMKASTILQLLTETKMAPYVS